MPLESIRGHKLFLIFICDCISYVFVIPCRHRDECVEIMAELVTAVRAKDGQTLVDKVIERIRSDNDTVFRSYAWDQMQRKLSLATPHSICYTPPQNGVVERFMQTFGSSLRTILIGVDKRLFCYGGEYQGWRWNRIGGRKYPRQPEYNGKAPVECRAHRFAQQTNNSNL